MLIKVAFTAPAHKIPPGIRHTEEAGAGGKNQGNRRATSPKRGRGCAIEEEMKPTDISAPDYFHKMVDCKWACPAHTPVAADYKDDIRERLPRPAAQKNGKRIALIGAGPASLTVARDLAPIGYELILFDQDPQAGGMMRTQIPKFRLPDSVIDEEVGYILDLGMEFRGGRRIESLEALLAEDFDAVFVGSGAPRGRDLDIPGRKEAAKNIHIGIDWLSSVSFGHIHKIGQRVIVLGGGNTAMDCCRSSRRLGGEDVKVVVRSGFEEMKASPWEKEDAMHEGIPIFN